MSAADPTNLLFIFSDQHTRLALGCMGHPVVKTPHLDALAERGTLFRNAYCNGPICVPSRASLATGRHVFDIEKWDNCKPYFGEEPSWGHRLMDRGRRAASIGKLHYRDADDPNGFDPELVPMHIMDGVGMLFTICRDPMPVSRKFADLVRKAGGGDSTYTDYDRDITERSVRWIREEATREDAPWALFVSLVCPHPPWLAPDAFYSLYPLEDIDLPVAYGLDDRPRHPGLEDYRAFFDIEGEFDETTLRKVIAAYYGMVSYLDDNIGKLVAALEETGLAAKTRILYTSDHGESMGQKGMMSKCNMYDESVGVPMILAGAGVPRANVVDTPAQLLDAFPTILEATGTEPTDEDRALTRHLALRARGGRGARTRHLLRAALRRREVRRLHAPPQRPQVRPVHGAGLSAPALRSREGPARARRSRGRSGSRRTRRGLRGRAPGRHRPRGGRCEGEGRPVAERIERGGGQEAIVAQGSLGYTPAPGEAPQYMT